jgi:hypothetical protein
MVRVWFLAAFMGMSLAARAECNVADIDAKITKSFWHNRCSKKDCSELRGTALLTSRCEEAVAVEVRLSGVDANGATVVALERWPYAISHVTAGEHEFSINKWLEHDPAIRGFVIEVVKIRPVNQQ